MAESIEELIDGIERRLKPLYKHKEDIDASILKLVGDRGKLLNKRDNLIISKIPTSKLKKITNDQWSWILNVDLNESSAKHSFRSNLLSKLGFTSFGIYEKTNQPIIAMLSKYCFKKSEVKFDILMPHIKHQTCRFGTKNDTGIIIKINGIQEDCSYVCVHKKGTCAFYFDLYCGPRHFKNFDLFLDWFDEQEEFNE